MRFTILAFLLSIIGSAVVLAAPIGITIDSDPVEITQRGQCLSCTSKNNPASDQPIPMRPPAPQAPVRPQSPVRPHGNHTPHPRPPRVFRPIGPHSSPGPERLGHGGHKRHPRPPSPVRPHGSPR